MKCKAYQYLYLQKSNLCVCKIVPLLHGLTMKEQVKSYKSSALYDTLEHSLLLKSTVMVNPILVHL